jgi:uncharacterized protein
VTWGAPVKAHVRSAPVDGAANEEVLKLLAKALGVAPSKLEIVRGHQGRTKWVEIAMDPTEFEAKVSALSAGQSAQA